MPDPILDAHEALPGFYLISPGVTPISIRDQMIRGRLIIDRLWELKKISDACPVLVVGAGAGGATAAICAAKRGVPTVLIDRAPSPFGVQLLSSTRYLDPVQYDWPVDHCFLGAFPWNGSSMPIRFPAEYSGILAALWTVDLNSAWRSLHGILSVYYRTEPVNITPTSGMLQVQFKGNSPSSKTFAAVVWASGMGREECRVFTNDLTRQPKYEGRPFWSSDPFSDPNCGVNGLEPHVLIAGAGDGGLQDFLRIATNKRSAEEVYRSCNIPLEVAQSIQSAEDRSHRYLAWAQSKNPLHEHSIHSELQTIHEEQAEYSLEINDVVSSLRRLIPKPQGEIQLVYRCSHFTNYYGLNRFLALLVAKYLEREFNITVLRPNTVIGDVSTIGTDGHACMEKVNGEWQPTGGYATPLCHGRDHHVELHSANDCRIQDQQYLETIVANVIIIRYGIRHGTVPLAPLPQKSLAQLQVSRSRHLLPYHLPV